VSSGPHPTGLAQARRAARAGGQRVSGAVAAVLGTGLALAAVLALVVLDYRFGQQAHRLVKIMAGGAVGALVLLLPRAGLFLLPVATPFLGWMPRIPVPGVNALNLLVFGVFFSWALRRVFAREPVFRRARLGWTLFAIMALAALSIVRGAAIPTGYNYSAATAGWTLVRAIMTFAIYFLGVWMARGAADRRRLGWAIVIALLAESVVTIAMGRSGHGQRAVGSFGQSNELGAYLALFTAFAAAQITATRNPFARVLLAGVVVAGTFALVLTVSRGAILALAVALGLVALRSSRVMVLVLLLALVTSPLWAPDYLKERVLGTEVRTGDSDERALEGGAQLRVDTWRAVLKVVSNHPVDGVGFNGLASVLPDTGEALGVEVKDSAHNTYLRFLAEMGVLGLLLFLWLLWRCWALAMEGMRRARDRADRQLALGLAAATVALAISCAFGDRFFSILITGNFFLLCALVEDAVVESRGRTA
jgi:O-antigen ligase